MPHGTQTLALWLGSKCVQLCVDAGCQSPVDTAAEKSSRPQRKGCSAMQRLLVCREKRKTDKAAARNKKAEDEKREKEEAAAAAAAAEAAAAETAAKERKARQVEKKAMQKQRSKLRTLSASLVSSEPHSPP